MQMRRAAAQSGGPPAWLKPFKSRSCRLCSAQRLHSPCLWTALVLKSRNKKNGVLIYFHQVFVPSFNAYFGVTRLYVWLEVGNFKCFLNRIMLLYISFLMKIP
ncbi:hypothetical protein Pfo_004739 [Paulownia fortunei]|nr:hypothetical protein Pfo_004739 [Paulownia fortunei]